MAEHRSLTLSRGYHLVLALVVLAALVAEVALTVSAGGAGEGTGTRLLRLASYFTIESNVLVLLASASLVLDPGRDGRWWRVLRLDALLGIVVTGVVFTAVLADDVERSGLGAWTNVTFHDVVPWAALLGWLLVGPRPRVDAATLARAFAWPLAYLAWTFLHGAATGWYPYPFLDVGGIGLPSALLSAALLVVGGLALALLLGLLDRLLPQAPGTASAPGRRSAAGSR